ncbi:MAG: dATP/dGTP diphosphohydrolase domain-containing protein [Methanofastidiosum sp.]
MKKYITKDSGVKEEFTTGMERDSREGKGRYDLISPFALKRLAGVYERGAAKRGERNWEKGGPFCRFIDSAERHIEQFKMGMDDEDHLAQAAWNLFAIMHFEDIGRTDLDDRPKWSV